MKGSGILVMVVSIINTHVGSLKRKADRERLKRLRDDVMWLRKRLMKFEVPE